MKPALHQQHTPTDKKIDKVDPGAVEAPRTLQTREATDATKVAEYAEIYRDGGALPPIVVFEEETGEGKAKTSTLWLGDGHHRLAAAKRADLEEIDALIQRGTRRDALWYAAAANAQHGLPRTNEDKRRAVGLILADEEWRQLSDAQLAEHVQVSDRLVAKVRKEVGAASTTRKGKDGKVRAKPVDRATRTAARQDINELFASTWGVLGSPGSGFEGLHEDKNAILAAMYATGRALTRDELRSITGKGPDTHLAGLSKKHLITGWPDSPARLASATLERIAAVMHSAKTGKPAAIKPATTIQRELCGDGVDMDEETLPDLPPGIYLDTDHVVGDFYVLISSDDQAMRVLVPGAKIRTSYGTGGVIAEVQPYRISGCQAYSVRLKDGGAINELVTWNGEIRCLFAGNYDRFTVGTGPKPKQGNDDSAELAKIGKPLRPAKPADVTPTRSDPGIALAEIIARLRIALASAGTTATAYAMKHKLPYLALTKLLATGIHSDDTYGPIYDHALTLPDTSASPPAGDAGQVDAAGSHTDGPEEITPPANPKPSPEVPPQPGRAWCGARPIELRRVDAQRDLIAVELGKGKPKWSGTDNDLFLLGLICGVPTRAQAWIDTSRAQARDLFIDALRSEVSERVRSGEAANTPKWPSIRELCALWSLDYASIEIRAERAVPA